MATVGLRDLYYSIVTENGDETTYAAPVRLAKAISAGLSVDVAEGKLYADDGVDEVAREFTGGTLTLNVNDLSIESAAAILGQKAGTDGVVYVSADDVAPYVAVGFRAKKSDGKFKYIWLYKVKFSVPSENYQTKGETITFNTPEITGNILKRPDGYWKADHVADEKDAIAADWFKAVKEPNYTT